MSHIKIVLKIISEPSTGTRTVLEIKRTFHTFSEKGGTDMVCGNCGQILIDSIGSDVVIKNVVIKCPNCGQFNEIPRI